MFCQKNKERLLNLTELNLESQNLTDLPREIGNIINLIMLDLEGNNIRLTDIQKEWIKYFKKKPFHIYRYI